MQSSNFKDFERTELALYPQILNPEIDEMVLQALSRLMGWDNDNRQFKLVRVDEDGRLQVSSGATQTNTANNSVVTVTTSSTTILANNPNRKSFLVQNNGSVDCYLELGDTALTASSLTLSVNQIFSTDLYTGVVSGIVSSSTTSIRVVEI